MTIEEKAKEATRNEFDCELCESFKDCIYGKGDNKPAYQDCIASIWEEGYIQALKDNPILQDIKEGKVLIVDKGWLAEHDKQVRDSWHELECLLSEASKIKK